MSHMREIIEYYLHPEEAKNFAKWAFGPSYTKLKRGPEFVLKWNERHKDKFILNENGKLDNDLPKMISTWLVEVHQQKLIKHPRKKKKKAINPSVD